MDAPDAASPDAGSTDDGGVACRAGTVACGDACVDLSTDPRHCGSCEKDCTQLPNVDASAVHCTNGTCDAKDACLANHAHCSADVNDGCETDLTLPTHCGDCTTACADPTPLCSAGADGKYACASGCNAPTPSSCGGTCVDLTTNPAHCGSCTNACPAPANSVANCAGSKCSSACKTGFADCNAKSADGCEIDTTKDSANCGVCGKACTGGTTCVQGACVCPAGLTNCGGVCKACCPNCTGRTCGTDGCGGTCGTCDACSTCDTAFGTCLPDGASNGRVCGGGAGRCCSGGGCINPCLPSGAACIVGVCSPTHCAGCCNGARAGAGGFVCN